MSLLICIGLVYFHCCIIFYCMLLLLLSHFSCVWLCSPIDGSPPGSPVPGILQARILEWVAISSSREWKWKVKVKSLSQVRLLATPWTAGHPHLYGLSYCFILVSFYTQEYKTMFLVGRRDIQVFLLTVCAFDRLVFPTPST